MHLLPLFQSARLCLCLFLLPPPLPPSHLRCLAVPLALSLPPLILPLPPPLPPRLPLPTFPLNLLFPPQLFDILLPSRAIHLATFRFMAALLLPLAESAYPCCQLTVNCGPKSTLSTVSVSPSLSLLDSIYKSCLYSCRNRSVSWSCCI